METVAIGDTDLRVSRVGLGCNNFGPMIGKGLDAAAAKAVVDAALESGITFFDTAEIYARGVSEEMLGAALAGRRDDVVIATKFGMLKEPGAPADGSAEYIAGAVDRSLQRLGTDHIDLYYYHRPDKVTPIAETLAGLDAVVRAGKVRYIGCSNFSAEQLREADEISQANGLARFVAVQNEYSLLVREVEEDVLPACRELGVGLVPYYPLASGVLTGKYERGESAPDGTRLALGLRGGTEAIDFDFLDQLTAFAQERGHSLLDLAIAAIASTPGVSGVIAGATRPEQARANGAAGNWTLSADELAAIPVPAVV
jgi:aryl-alcohol dehydrogenase-like predicted oxidoreductase